MFSLVSSSDGVKMLNWGRIITAYAVFQIFLVCQTDSSCYFPTLWNGDWKETEKKSLRIDGSVINREESGRCVESRGDKYIVFYSKEQCYKCFEFYERHRNILQYRVSYCQPRDSFDRLCSFDFTEFNTLVRENAQPIKCPFNDAFHFKYNNQSGGWCKSPPSNAHNCASDSKYRFSFRFCPGDFAYTFDQDFDILCLAEWRNGHDYLYGAIVNREPFGPYRDIYRCMMYRRAGNNYYVTMTPDGTCWGLRSPENGPLKIQMTRDFSKEELPASCTFPNWITDSRFFRTIAGNEIYDFTSLKQLAIKDLNGQIDFRASCIRSEETTHRHRKFIALFYVKQGCDSTFQCIRFMKKQEKLIEIDFSEKSNDPRLRCRPRELKNYQKSIIYADDEDRNVICPFMGKYSATLDGKGICSGTFRIGCSAPDRMEIDNECFGSITSNLKCVYTWKARRKHYVLAKSLDGEIANCYSFQENSKNSLKFERESWCSYGASTIFKPNSFFLTNRKAIDRCYQPQETNRKSEKVKEDKAQQNPPYDKISRDRPRRIHQEDNKSNYHTPSTSVISLLFILVLNISY